MPSLMVLALISLGLVAALLLLVRRRQAEESAPRPVRRPGDPGDLVSALVVELAVTPEAVKSRRRQLPPTTVPTSTTPTTPTSPAAAAAPRASPAPSVAPVDAGPPPTPAVWAHRRSPYASGAMGGQRISLPDDDTDFDIRWRPYEQPAATTQAPPSPLARTTQVSADGRIQVGHGDEDGDDVVSWPTRPA